MALWRRMPEAGVAPTPGTLATVLRACRLAYQGERALSLLAEARAAGVGAGLGFTQIRAARVTGKLCSLHCLYHSASGLHSPQVRHLPRSLRWRPVTADPGACVEFACKVSGVCVTRLRRAPLALALLRAPGQGQHAADARLQDVTAAATSALHSAEGSMRQACARTW